MVLIKLREGARCTRCCPEYAYRSQFSSSRDRAFARRDQIMKRLGAPRGPTACIGAKPRGMRWATFGRLVREAQEAELRAPQAGLAAVRRPQADHRNEG